MNARGNQVVLRAAVSAALLIAFHSVEAKSPNGPPNGFPNIPNLNSGWSSKGPGGPGQGNSTKDFGFAGQGKGGPGDTGSSGKGSSGKGSSEKGAFDKDSDKESRSGSQSTDRGSDRGGPGSEGRGDSSGSDKDSPKDNLQASAGGRESTARKSKPLHVLPTCD
jgi:hypothetical protein